MTPLWLKVLLFGFGWAFAGVLVLVACFLAGAIGPCHTPDYALWVFWGLVGAWFWGGVLIFVWMVRRDRSNRSNVDTALARARVRRGKV